jgi:hypothetical protein
MRGRGDHSSVAQAATANSIDAQAAGPRTAARPQPSSAERSVVAAAIGSSATAASANAGASQRWMPLVGGAAGGAGGRCRWAGSAVVPGSLATTGMAMVASSPGGSGRVPTRTCGRAGAGPAERPPGGAGAGSVDGFGCGAGGRRPGWGAGAGRPGWPEGAGRGASGPGAGRACGRPVGGSRRGTGGASGRAPAGGGRRPGGAGGVRPRRGSPPRSVDVTVHAPPRRSGAPPG